MKKALVLAPAFPGDSGGYEVAIKSSLFTFQVFFDQVKAIYVVPEIRFKKNTVGGADLGVVLCYNKKSIVERVVGSLFSLTPASIMQYKEKKMALAVISAIENELAKLGFDNELFLIVEDIPLAYYVFSLSADIRSSIKIIIRSHNVFANIFRGLNVGVFVAFFKAYEIFRMRRFELAVHCFSDFFYAITDADAAEYIDNYGIKCDGVISVGLDYMSYVDQSGVPGDILYIGSVDLRKSQGINYFLDKIFPILKKNIPEIRFHIAGRNSETLDSYYEGVLGYGFVDDIEEVWRKGAFFVNPQLSGSGIKIKSISAIQHSKVLLSSPIGIEGTGLADDINCVCYSSVESFVSRFMLLDKCDVVRLSKSANDFFLKNYLYENFHSDISLL